MDADERVILFLKLDTSAALNDTFKTAIKKRIRERRSPRHVPAVILQVSDVPVAYIRYRMQYTKLNKWLMQYTINNKKVEVPVKRLINGSPLTSINLATLRNPECLDEFVKLGEQLRAEVTKGQ